MPVGNFLKNTKSTFIPVRDESAAVPPLLRRAIGSHHPGNRQMRIRRIQRLESIWRSRLRFAGLTARDRFLLLADRMHPVRESRRLTEGFKGLLRSELRQPGSTGSTLNLRRSLPVWRLLLTFLRRRICICPSSPYVQGKDRFNSYYMQYCTKLQGGTARSAKGAADRRRTDRMTWLERILVAVAKLPPCLANSLSEPASFRRQKAGSLFRNSCLVRPSVSTPFQLSVSVFRCPFGFLLLPPAVCLRMPLGDFPYLRVNARVKE